MFKPRLFDASPAHERVYGLYERIYTLFDVLAAWLFVVGSALFFYREWQEAGTWCFLLGSLCFAAKPTVRFLRERHLSRLPLPGDETLRGEDG